MKKKFSRMLGVGLSFMLLASLLTFAAPVSADTLDWGEEDLPTVKVGLGSGKVVQPDSDILCLSAANDEKTAWIAISDEGTNSYVFRSTDAGKSWWKKTPLTPKPTGSADPRITHVAVSPDDPTVVVAAGTANVSGKWVNHVWISTDKGETWSPSNVSDELDGTITSLAFSKERDDTRWVAVGSDAAATPFTLITLGEGTAEWSSDTANTGSYSAKLTIPAGADWDDAARVQVTYGELLSTLSNDNIKYWYSYEGTPHNSFVRLDIDADGNGIRDHGLISRKQAATVYDGTWTQTLQEDYWQLHTCNETTQVCSSVSWGTFANQKAAIGSTATAIVMNVLVMMGPTTVPQPATESMYIDDITINDTIYPVAGKCLTVARAEAFASWSNAAAWLGFSDASAAANGVLAVAFSPWFNNDDTLLAVTASDGPEGTYLQAAEVADTWSACEFNPTSFANYPVEIGDGIVATAASISLPDDYYGIDIAERIAYIGTSSGVFRLEDVDSTKIKSGDYPWVAYNSEENQLLVGRADAGRVDMSDNPDSGSPSFTRPASMKSPSGEGVSGVGWLGETMICSTKDIGAATTDDESAISVSTDARSWNQLSLIDTDLDNITDVAVSEDGNKVYFTSQNSVDSFYSVWRYAGSWQRVLCEDATAATEVPIIRLAPEKPEVVFVALTGTKEIRRSTDSGETWKQSRSDIIVTDMAAKDDKVVHVASSYKVSTSKDGARTFADYVKSNVSTSQIIVAPNGDVLVVGVDIIKSPAKISVAISTDDGATWKRMSKTSGLTKTTNPVLVAVDTDFATNSLIYVGHTDGGDANILRWEIGGDYEQWQDIGTAYYSPKVYGAMTASQVISGLVCQEGMLYLAYYSSSASENLSGFISTNCPTIKRTSVTWGGGPGTEAEVGSALDSVRFTLTPQSLVVSAGSAKLWAVDTEVVSGKGNRLYSYRDILAKVEAPAITLPADKYLATLDAAREKVNPINFSWDEVNPDVEYQLRIGSNAAVSKHYVTYSTGDSEFLTVCEGGMVAADKTYAFVSGETYYWKVRVKEPTVSPWSETRSFTIEKIEAVAAPPEVTVQPPEVTVAAPPAPEVTVTVQPAPPAPAPAIPPAIPMWTLWTIIVIGAVLVIAVIVLIVRTRRVV